jgi:hypothetical protein
MLGPAMMNGVSCHIYSTNVVTEDNSSRLERQMKLLKKLAQSTTLGDSMSDGTVLRFCTGARDSGLALGRPRHQCVTKEDAVA